MNTLSIRKYLDATFTRNRALFGDARMDDPTEEEKAAAEAKAAEEAAAAAKAAEEAAAIKAVEDEALGAAGQKALDAWKTKAKEEAAKAKALADQVANYQAADEETKKKANEAAAAAQKVADDASLQATRWKVIATKGLSVELADRLRGTTEEELLADADVLLKLAPPAKKPIPKSNPASKTNGDPGSLEEQIAEAEAKKDFVTSRRLKSQLVAQRMQNRGTPAATS